MKHTIFADHQEISKDSSPTESSLHKNKTKEKIAKSDKVFAPMTYSNSINQFITAITLIYWISITVYIYTILLRNDKKNIFSLQSRLGFLPYFTIIVLYPILYFVNQMVHTRLGGYGARLSNLKPDFAVCTKNTSQLTDQERLAGAVGKLNYKCYNDVGTFTRKYGDMITRRTYYIIHSLFVLTLFLFTQSAGKFKNTIVSSDSTFITVLMQHCLFISLLLMTVQMLIGYQYITTYLLFLYMNLLQILGALTVMMVTFILYRLIYLYVD